MILPSHHLAGVLPNHVLAAVAAQALAQVVGVEGVGQGEPQRAQRQEPETAMDEQSLVRAVSRPQGQGQEQGDVKGQQVQPAQEQLAFRDA